MGTTAKENNRERIKGQIEAIRDRMMKLGNVYGLDDQRVLKASRELDALIVYYHRSMAQTWKSSADA